MSATPTQPLNQPPPAPVEIPAVAEYVEKVRALLAILLVVAWVGILILWTYHAPLVPGDVAGQAAGGFNMVMGVIVGYYYATMMQGKKDNGK